MMLSSFKFMKIVEILSIISYKTINGDEFQELAITIMVFVYYAHAASVTVVDHD